MPFFLNKKKEKKKVILNGKKMRVAKEGAGGSSQEFRGRFVSLGIKKSSPCHQKKKSSLILKYSAQMPMGKGRGLQKPQTVAPQQAPLQSLTEWLRELSYIKL